MRNGVCGGICGGAYATVKPDGGGGVRAYYGGGATPKLPRARVCGVPVAVLCPGTRRSRRSRRRRGRPIYARGRERSTPEYVCV